MATVPIDYTRTFLGRVRSITYNSVVYPVADDGVVITLAMEQNIQKVVGSVVPALTIGAMYYRIDAVLSENTLGSLQIAWNLPASAYSSFAASERLNLGYFQTFSPRVLVVTGLVYTINRTRTYTFNNVCVFEPKPQTHQPNNIVKIPVSFYAYGDDTASGSEFGTIIQAR